MKPIVVNLFGGPGTGKSTGAAYIFSYLKMHGVNAELVTEFAKDKTWEKNSKALMCQPYVFGKQVYRMDRCADQVDIIVTDSPILLSSIYNTDELLEPEFTAMVVKKFNEFTNYNFFLERVKEYNPVGRSQTEDEAKSIDSVVLETFKKFGISYQVENADSTGYKRIADTIMSVVKEK